MNSKIKYHDYLIRGDIDISNIIVRMVLSLSDQR